MFWNVRVDIATSSIWHPSFPPPGTTKPQVDRSKKLLLLINPNSGPGRALQIYRKQVSPILAEAEVSHEVIVTERANHATEIVRDLDLTKYAGLVILSGDGLLYEVRELLLLCCLACPEQPWSCIIPFLALLFSCLSLLLLTWLFLFALHYLHALPFLSLPSSHLDVPCLTLIHVLCLSLYHLVLNHPAVLCPPLPCPFFRCLHPILLCHALYSFFPTFPCTTLSYLILLSCALPSPNSPCPIPSCLPLSFPCVAISYWWWREYFVFPPLFTKW